MAFIKQKGNIAMLNFDSSNFKKKFDLEKAREKIKSDIEYLNEVERILYPNKPPILYSDSDYVSEDCFQKFISYYREKCSKLKEKFKNIYPNWPKDRRSIFLIKCLAEFSTIDSSDGKVRSTNPLFRTPLNFVSKNRQKEKIYCFINRINKWSGEFVCEAISESGDHLMTAVHKEEEECKNILGFNENEYSEQYKKWYHNGYELIWLGFVKSRTYDNRLNSAINLYKARCMEDRINKELIGVKNERKYG